MTTLNKLDKNDLQPETHVGDCLMIMKSMASDSIDLIYLDPPFYSQRNHRLISKSGQEYTFSDTWSSRGEYLEYMKDRLVEMQRVLSHNGSIYLHCDSSAVHYLKVLMDDVFGEDNFQNEIIWTYRKWSNSRKGYLNCHQNILFYTKSKDFYFNRQYVNYSLTTNIDQILQLREKNKSGKTIYKRDELGEVVLSSQKKGVPLSDVWDIPFLNPRAKERVGYPTQKPLELIERIIGISSQEGDIVLDPFCGSGTTLVAAKRLGRYPIGVDINQEAIVLTRERLKSMVKTESFLLRNGISFYDNKDNESKSILKCIDCDVVQRNKGLDAILKKTYNNKPIGLKIQKKNEALELSVSLLHNAICKKNLELGILVKTNHQQELFHSIVPHNVLIVNSFNVELERVINEYAQQS